MTLAPKIGIGKRFVDGLPMIPTLAQRLMWEVARRMGNYAPLLLIVKFALSPVQVAKAAIGPDGLIVADFERPVPVVDPVDRAEIEEWLRRPRRRRSAQSLENFLVNELPVATEEELGQHEERTGDWTGWRIHLRLGARELALLSMELNGEACGYDPAVFKELMHSRNADVNDTLRLLTKRARGILSRAAASEARKVKERMVAYGLDGF